MSETPASKAAGRGGRSRGWVKILLKALVSAALLAYVLTGVDLAALVQVTRRLDLRWFLLSFGVFLVSIALRSFKWQLMLRRSSVRMGFCACVAYYWIGTFWNMLLPTRVGGDVVKMFLVRRAVGEDARIPAMVSVVTDRLTNILSLFALGVLSLPLLAGLSRGALISFVLLCAICAGTVLAARRRWASRAAGRWLSSGHRLGRLSVEILEPFETQLADWRSALVFLGLGGLMQFLMVLNTSLIGRALGVELPLVNYLWSVCVVSVVTLLPVTVNGLGLREGVFVKMTGVWGLLPEQAFAVSILTFAMTLVGSLPGGLIYLLMDHGPKTEWREEP